MRKIFYKEINSRTIKGWDKLKEKEWKANADFWIEIIRGNLDPYREKLTNKAILDRIPKEDKKLNILDAGCGEGYLSRKIAKMGHKVYGIDFCSKLIESAKKLEEQKKLGIKYFIGDFRNTTFKSSFFDIIISHHTINEIPNPKRAIKEFSRILKRGGKLVLLFLHPCFNIDQQFLQNYFYAIKIQKEFYLVSGKKSKSPYFYLHLPLSTWGSYLEESGFLIKKIAEPRPPEELLKKNKWWKTNFKKPLFILIEAVKF